MLPNFYLWMKVAKLKYWHIVYSKSLCPGSKVFLQFVSYSSSSHVPTYIVLLSIQYNENVLLLLHVPANYTRVIHRATTFLFIDLNKLLSIPSIQSSSLGTSCFASSFSFYQNIGIAMVFYPTLFVSSTCHMP